jgi:hypothetical protein
MIMTPTLEAVQAEFRQWRQHKPYLRSPTPNELKGRALALLAHHSPVDVCKALGITRCMLKTWQGPVRPDSAATAETIEFVTLPIEPLPAPRPGTPVTLALTLANGDHWSLQGDPSAEQLSAFFAALSGGAT